MPSVNPMDLISMMKNGLNPQQLAMSMLEKNMKGNPIMENLYTLAKGNRGDEIHQVVRNAFQSQGRNFDEEFSAFRKTYGL